MRTLDTELCRAYLGMDRDYWAVAQTALDFILRDSAAATLLLHARCLLLEQRDLGRAEPVCRALQARSKEHRHMAVAALLGFTLPGALENLRHEGVAEEILKDTFRDFARWAAHYEGRNDTRGVGELPWLLYPYVGRMFKLGRLMYELFEFPFPFCAYAVPGEVLPVVLPVETTPPEHAELVLSPGFPAVNLHIPAEGSLRPDLVDDSLRQAKCFFEERGYPARISVCESWLLDTSLPDFLPAEGNIVRFMERFVTFPVEVTPPSAGSYVFGPKFTWPHWIDAPEDTGVQRALKSYLISGGTVRDTGGVLWL